MKKLFQKKLGVLGLTFAMALSVFGGVFFASETAFADDATVTTTSLVTGTSATVGVDSGLRVSSSEAYNATLKGVFTGDTKFVFDFPETDAAHNSGDFVITIADIDNPANNFKVAYYMCDTWNSTDGFTGAAVNYGEEWRSSRYWGNLWWNKKASGYDSTYAAPSILNKRGEANGILDLVWENGVLSVYVNRHDDDTMRLLAAFDGTTAFEDQVSWGLPKLNFASGYTVSISSSYSNAATTDKATDVTFKSITTGGTTYDLTQETMVKPVFMSAYEMAEGSPVEGGLAAALGATVEGNKVNGTAGVGYQGEIPYTLKGNTAINFTFSDLPSGAWISEDYALNFTYSICDLNNNVVFQVVYKGDNTATQVYVVYGDQIRTNVKHVNVEPWDNDGGFYFYNKVPAWKYGRFAPDMFNTASDTGTLKIKFVGDTVQVWATYLDGAQWLIASFDGSDEGFTPTSGYVASENFVAWGLPKIYNQLKDGYKVKYDTTNVSSNSTQFDLDVTFNSVTTSSATPNNSIDRLTEIPKSMTVTGATAAWEKNIDGQTGMNFKAEPKTAFTAQIPGYMQGGTTIKFAFPHTRTTWEPADDWQKAHFIVKDMAGEEVFRVSYVLCGGMYTRTLVAYPTVEGVLYRSHSSQMSSWAEGYSFGDKFEGIDCVNMAPGLGSSGLARIAANMQIAIHGDVVSVWAFDATANRMFEIAAFDGTSVEYTQDPGDGKFVIPKAEFKGYNLPKIYDRVKDGYTIELQTEVENKETHDVDVTIMSVDTANYFNTVSYGGEAQKVDYKGKVTLAAAPQVEEGKVFLGWKDKATGELYQANKAITVSKNMKFEAVTLTFNMFGASIRLDPTGNTSGIRFKTDYNAAEMEAVKGYVKSMGTIIAKTASLEGKDFVIENFTVGTDLAKIVNTKEHFETANGKAYSAALTNLKAANIDQAFSARGYLEVEYADGSVAYVYTDYNQADNSRSVKAVAQAVKLDVAYYNSLDAGAKAVIDAYAE